jgi:hypothetical protein
MRGYLNHHSSPTPILPGILNTENLVASDGAKGVYETSALEISSRITAEETHINLKISF